MTNTIRESYEKIFKGSAGNIEQTGNAGKIEIQIGSATCENAAGAPVVEEEFRKHIAASGRDDIVVRRTGCTGRCSREPIVGVFAPNTMPVKYQQVNRDLVHKIFTAHIMGGDPLVEGILDSDENPVARYEFLFCARDRCDKDKRRTFRELFSEKLEQAGVADRIEVETSRCFGACREEQVGQIGYVLVRPDNVLYQLNEESDLDEIIEKHVKKGVTVDRLKSPSELVDQDFLDLYGDVAFFNHQSRIALRNCGVIDPESLDEYLQHRGFQALTKALENGDPEWVVDEVTKSGVRGRGGGGYPTGKKWAIGRQAEETRRFMICNADEGDPGAFMDRSMLESDPFSVVEGMLLAGYAIGAQRGFFYIRAEYPLAVRRVEHAIAECRKRGLLGENILGSDFSFDMEIRLGAGAFVCGEETALIHSIEGERGQPRIRPPYPAQKGLWGYPTIINNVETLANLAVIINHGGDWFKAMGRGESGGTKVFALAGKVNHTGLVEVPIGTTLREVVYEIGGGVADGKNLKAVQTGGPAGGCIPAKWIDTKVDFDTLAEAGSIMGSGGMIVLDEDDCMVDIAKFFLTFSQDESCGKCTPCREGTTRMLEILERITIGKGTTEDLDTLERLAKLVQRTSLCGLGRAAPNPLLSTLTHFREEYEAHVVDKKCPAKKCTALVTYEIDADKCVGCTACARKCPVQCIHGERREPHVIDQNECIKCGQCHTVCRFEAVNRA